MPKSQIYLQMAIIILLIFVPMLMGGIWLAVRLLRREGKLIKKCMLIGFALGALVPTLTLLRHLKEIEIGLARIIGLGFLGALVGGLIATIVQRIKKIAP